MISRLFYLLAGAALGGYVAHKLNRTARAWSPGGIAHRVEGRVNGYRTALRELGEDIHGAMERHEEELRRQYYPAAVERRRALDGADPETREIR